MRVKATARLSLFLQLLALTLVCHAEEPSSMLTPREIFVGDEAVFSYIEENIPLNELFPSLEAGTAFEVPRDLLPADSSDVTVKSVRLIPLQGMEDAAMCEITFIPWKTGESTIPKIAFTPDGAHRSRSIKVTIPSLAARYGTTALMPNRPPLLPPGALYLLYALVFCFAVSCFALALAVRMILLRGKGTRRIPVKKIRREFAKLIKAQRRRIRKNQSAWYAEFSAIARLFFYKMTNEKKHLAADARDIAQFLEEAQSSFTDEDAAAAKRLTAALFQIEQIRFSGEEYAKGSDQGNELKRSYLEAFEHFVALACTAPETFFTRAEKGDEAFSRNAVADFSKKGKASAVV